jgi:DNA primase large subunit
MAFSFTPITAKKEPVLDSKKSLDVDRSKGYYTMYRTRPAANSELTIDKFEEATLKRMKLLSKLYELDGRRAGEGFMDQAKTLAESDAFRFECRKGCDEDVLSHYALRLGLCISERWRQWFVKYELLLFKARVSALSSVQQQELLHLNNIRAEEVGAEEMAELRGRLSALLDIDDRGAADDKYYKVPFQRVLRLVEKRKVLLKAGLAYVGHRHVMQLLEGSFRTHLMAELMKAMKKRSLLEPTERDRILAFLDHVLENHDADPHATGEAVEPGARLDRRQVHEVAQVHFPLCMRHLDEKLRDNHHLKFSGRWQYGLFIKQLGLSMDDALEFWKGELVQGGKVSVENWGKSHYAYNIRHYYGAEGKRTSYSAVSCTKIILGPAPAPEQYHGCPFRHWNETQLRRELQKPRPHPAANAKQSAVFGARIDLSFAQIDDVVKKAKDGFYTAACHQYFTATHPGTTEESLFNNPVHYYVASRKYTEISNAQEALQAAPSPVQSAQSSTQPRDLKTKDPPSPPRTSKGPGSPEKGSEMQLDAP